MATVPRLPRLLLLLLVSASSHTRMQQSNPDAAISNPSGLTAKADTPSPAPVSTASVVAVAGLKGGARTMACTIRAKPGSYARSLRSRSQSTHADGLALSLTLPP